MIKSAIMAAAALAFVSSSAFAHGTVAQQSQDASKVAIGQFEKSQPLTVRRQFLSVSSVLMGHEHFSVVITLKDKVTTFAYDCLENEQVDPVIWECEAVETP